MTESTWAQNRIVEMRGELRRQTQLLERQTQLLERLVEAIPSATSATYVAASNDGGEHVEAPL